MNDNIRDIIDKINSEKNNASDLPDTFEFEVGEENSVFEYGEKTEEVSEDVPESTDEPTVEATQPLFEAMEEKPEEHTVDTPQGIFKAYVPRFTEVSETYRMKNDPRPRKDGKTVVTLEEEKVVEEKEIVQDSYATEQVDPTAELEENVPDAVIVNMSMPTEDEDADTLNVYKFAQNESAPEEVKERTVDDEREEINRLISRPEEKAEDAAVEAEAEETIAPDTAEPKHFDLPDPDSGINVVDFDEDSEQKGISPDGVSEYVPEKGKGIGREFELPIQRDSIKDRFLDAIMAARIRLGAIAFFTLLILAFEISVRYNLFDYKKLALFTFSGSVAVIDFLLGASVFLLALPEILRALAAFIDKKIVSELSLLIGFAVLLGYTMSILLIKVYTYPLYGFLFALLPLFAVIGTLSRLNADFLAFKLISKNGEKQILEKKLTRELPEENLALDGLVDEYSSRTARIFRAAFITDFYKRTSVASEKNSHNGLVMGLSLALSLIVSVICYFLVDGVVTVPSSFALVFLLGFPAFLLLSHKVPFRYAESSAFSEESAVLGEQSCFDFSDVDVICFEDSEIFGVDDVNLKRFMLYGDRDNMENVMRKMCSLFSVVGGPLKTIFFNALDNRVRHNPATNVSVDSDGLCGEIGGRMIYAGTEEYMLRHGIAIPEGAAGNERKNDTTKIMYAAEDKEVYAKFYIRYSFSEEFTMLLPALKEQGITPLIYTSDPNLSNDLLKRLTAGQDSVRVMKRYTPGTTDEKLHNRVSSGMVTVGDKINAINLVLLAKKYKRFSERITVSELTAMGAGIVAGAILSFLGVTDILMAMLGAWHLLWAMVLLFSSKKAFLKGKHPTEEQENG